MEPQIIKLSSQSIEIPAFPFYVHIISILFVIFLLNQFLGKQIYYLWNYCINKFVRRPEKILIKEWIARCRDRREWPQKQDVLSLDLKGKYLKSLIFSVTLAGRPVHWRAGFVIGNINFKVNEIVDTKNGITVHTGSGYEKKNRILPLWRFYNHFDRNNPDFISIKSDDSGNRSFTIDIDEDNFLKVKVQNELVFAEKIDPSFRRKVYLKAWVDDAEDAMIKFRNISYTLWD